MNKEVYGMEDDVDLSSDEEDSSDDESEKLERRAEEIERELSNNVYLYDLHKELVQILEKLADLSSLRLAYDRFAKTFPLTQDLWLAWINVEVPLATSAPDKKIIAGLFERATKDYLSVKLWLEYVQFAMSNFELKETHDILERALSVAGLHYTDASLLWDILRELESAHLSITPKESEAYQSQLKKVIDAFKRQLSVPLVNISNTYEEWQDFVSQMAEDGIDATVVDPGYNAAVKTLELYKPYEERLLMSTTDEEIYEIYKEYIKHVKDPNLVLCLYERAVEKLCLRAEVWVDYINYALKLGDVSLNISERALRNVTWHEGLWCLNLRILEKHEKPLADVIQCFENGLMNCSGGLELWLDYISYTKRNSPDKLLKLLAQAGEQQINDPEFKITRYHAQTCANKGQFEEARQLWNNLMHEPQVKSSVRFWLEYVRFEKQYGNNASVRGVFNRAITCNTDWPQGIADEWMMFERDEGTIEDVFKCTEKINKILPQKLKAQEEATATVVVTGNEPKIENGKRKRDAPEQKVDRSQSKRSKTEDKRPVPKNQGPPADLDPLKSVFVSNISPTVTQQQLAMLFPNGKVTLATNNKGSSRCFGYVQFASEENAQVALTRDREFFESRPIFISKCKTDAEERSAAFKFSQKTENNKLFVRGLPVKYTTEDVENIFKPYNCTNVRLVLHRSGKSKGLAYVEFGNEDDAEKALKATNNMTLDGLIISVAISAPPPKAAKAEKPPEPQRHSRSRLQVPLIPRAAMKMPPPQTSAEGNSTTATPKSNADFRNLLMRK